MKNVKQLLFITFAVSAFILSACNFPTENNADNTAATAVALTANAVFTQAAETAAIPIASATTAPGATLLPTNTSLPPTVPPPTVTKTPIPCNRASFVKDVTYPDGAEVAAGSSFTKTWRIKNNGSCTWTSGYVLLFDSGDQMNAPATGPVTSGTVAPGETVDISVNLTAPGAPGSYQGNFKLRSADNIVFGINANAQGPFWVKIVVPAPTATATNVPPTPTATIAPIGDLSIIEVFLSTHAEVIIRVSTQPAASLSGNFQYTVYADGAQVAQGTCPVPTGSNACWTGYTVSGSHSIQTVIDSNNAIAESNEGNNSTTVTCDSSSLSCH
jgi:hypothetical protein